VLGLRLKRRSVSKASSACVSEQRYNQAEAVQDVVRRSGQALISGVQEQERLDCQPSTAQYATKDTLLAQNAPHAPQRVGEWGALSYLTDGGC
jgi:hypothetical protein